jgi:hypothetical protein
MQNPLKNKSLKTGAVQGELTGVKVVLIDRSLICMEPLIYIFFNLKGNCSLNSEKRLRTKKALIISNGCPLQITENRIGLARIPSTAGTSPRLQFKVIFAEIQTNYCSSSTVCQYPISASSESLVTPQITEPVSDGECKKQLAKFDLDVNGLLLSVLCSGRRVAMDKPHI